MTEDGLKAIFFEIRPMLLRMLVARLGNREDAEDTLQDMWLRIDQLAAGPIGQPAGFLYRVAANLATDRRIAVARRGARDTAWLDVQPVAEEIPDAERALIARERLQAVEQAIADMPDRMRTALRMFRFEEQPQRKIAEDLGISVSGVEKLLQRAYRQIHDACEIFAVDDCERRRLSHEGDPKSGQ
ncbi:RNA polymerase subunit sigma-70 [Sphingomonas sp. Leaf357]|uniref:RNA polymerase sigma factor n=1 Tax=Sphingomonas sp. Leaf357 TaxID=1736350 RepID=UPI0006FEDEDE|nr:sigma-70 family RNA polymerase sigma factor [Sphingomonas sp. Leaf357]KQS01559.1 RNA polymerase subunit sigma-70 [Sphingomonas sp. Leaf357]